MAKISSKILLLERKFLISALQIKRVKLVQFLYLPTSCKYGLRNERTWRRRSGIRIKTSIKPFAALALAIAIATVAAVFSLLVFCVASRFVSYWTAAKGKRKEGEGRGREAAFFLLLFSPFWCFSKSLRRQLREKKLPETISPFSQRTLSASFPSDLSRINSYTNSSKA